MRDDEIVVPIAGAPVYTAEEAAALLKKAFGERAPITVHVTLEGKELARALLPEIAQIIRNTPSGAS